MSEDERVVGIVSEGDILFKERGPTKREGTFARLSTAFGRDDQRKPAAQTAADAMTAPAKIIAPWRPVSAAAAQMLEEGVNRVPVVDEECRLVGIVTRADLVAEFVSAPVAKVPGVLRVESSIGRQEDNRTHRSTPAVVGTRHGTCRGAPSAARIAQCLSG